MLESLRKGATGWVAKVFLGLLVLSFAVWGIEDIFRSGGGKNIAAQVGDREITVEEFRQSYSAELRRIGQQARRVITPEQARIAGIGERVIGNMINEAALDERARTMGLAVSDEEVAREIQADEVFRGPTGGFDRTRFQEILRQNNLNENGYIALQRAFTTRRQITDALTSNVEAPTALKQAVHAYVSDSRSISYVELTPEEPAAVPAPGEDVLKAFYDSRKDAFAAPEYRKLAVLSLDPATLAQGQDVPEEELKAYYETNRPKFATEERRSIEQITFPTVEEARAASEQIKNGGLFEQVLVQRKMKPADAFLGNLTKADLFDPAIAEAAFALEPGKVSEPVEGAYSTALLRVTGVQRETTKDFPTVREDIRKAVALERAKAQVLSLHDRIDEARLGGATLEEISKAQNLPLRLVEAVDSAGKAPDGAAVADLPQSQRLLEESFRAEVGQETEVISASDSFVWYEVRGVTPRREKTFEESRPAVEAAWREEEARKRLAARAEAIIAELGGGKTLEQVAEANSLSVEQAETTRTGGAPSITPAQATAVFATPVEGFGMTGAAENGARLVFRVVAENTRPYDPAAPDASGQIDRIAESIGNDMATSFVQKLRDDLGTTLNAGAISQVAGGGEG